MKKLRPLGQVKGRQYAELGVKSKHGSDSDSDDNLDLAYESGNFDADVKSYFWYLILFLFHQGGSEDELEDVEISFDSPGKRPQLDTDTMNAQTAATLVERGRQLMNALLFSWMVPLLQLGAERPLMQTDL